MSGGTIFLVDADGNLARMRPGAPASEDRMQMLIAQHPELIADGDGDLLLIRREQPIADEPDGAGRWSVDHLFVTRDGVPVLVEVKRAADTRLRREVVGQLLDYAANAVVHWPVGRVANAFAESCRAAEQDPDTVLQEFIGDADAATFWAQVDANFAAGRLKLVFVADSIPRELARIVEFLNEQMRADVRAVELRWFDGENDVTTLVPRVIGETERAASQKPGRRGLPADLSRDEWLQAHIEPRGSNAMAGAHAYIALVERLGGRAIVARQQGSIIACFPREDGGTAYVFQLWRDGNVSISFRWLINCPRLAEEAARRAYYERIVAVAGPLSTENVGGYPALRVEKLSDEEFVRSLESVARDLVADATAAEVAP